MLYILENVSFNKGIYSTNNLKIWFWKLFKFTARWINVFFYMFDIFELSSWNLFVDESLDGGPEVVLEPFDILGTNDVIWGGPCWVNLHFTSFAKPENNFDNFDNLQCSINYKVVLKNGPDLIACQGPPNLRLAFNNKNKQGPMMQSATYRPWKNPLLEARTMKGSCFCIDVHLYHNFSKKKFLSLAFFCKTYLWIKLTG